MNQNASDAGLDWTDPRSLAKLAGDPFFEFNPDVKIQPFEELLGKTCVHAEHVRRQSDDHVILVFCDGSILLMIHHQAGRETVRIENIEGSLRALAGSALLSIDEANEWLDQVDDADPNLWTYLTLRTTSGSVTIQWYRNAAGGFPTDISIDCWAPRAPLSNHQQLMLTRRAQEIPANGS